MYKQLTSEQRYTISVLLQKRVRNNLIAKRLCATVCFAHPYSSWEKGAIENMNGLIRQYIPKNTDFRGISHTYIRRVMDKINDRPRKKNNFCKPKDHVKQLIT